MRLLPPGIITSLIGFASFGLQASAIEIYGYSAGLHDRVLKYPGAPIFDQNPEINPTFVPSAGLFRGIGWPADAQNWTRQMALISPRHFLCATHYSPEIGWQIVFLGSDGNQHLYSVASKTPVLNPQGQPTDLMLCTLGSPVKVELGIKPFRIVNPTNASSLVGQDAVICGSMTKTGKMKLAGFTTLPNDAGFDTTEFIYHDYFVSSASSGNCYYEGGDSGSPAFVMVNGEPAIVGTASAVDRFSADHVRGYMSYVPAYLSQLDSMMEPLGYHVKRAYPEAALIATQIVGDGIPRQRKPGSVTIFQENTSTAKAHNVSMRITFSSAPTTVTGDGWICESISPTVWNCRQAELGVAGQTSIKPRWDSLPKTGSLQISIVESYDGVADTVLNQTIPLLESYSSWIEGASNVAQLADPDGDAISNLLEYALGGSPSVASALSSYGHPILPRLQQTPSQVLLKFPRRLDATMRGLTHRVEYSTSLEEGSWSGNPPAGTSLTSAPFAPWWDGFEEVTVTVPRSSSRQFLRVRVELTE